MSGLETALVMSMAATALGTVSSISQASQQRKAQSQTLALQAQQAQAQMADLERQRAKADQDRRARLARATATQRAAFAGAGISSDGSGDAVFENLLTQSLREKQDIDDKVNSSIRSLQDSLQLNLLKAPKSDPFGTAAMIARSGASIINDGRQIDWSKF